MEWSHLTHADRFALASFLGLMVGLEREVRGKSAGSRTFALIAFGAAAFTGIALDLFPDSGDRVIQGVVAGIGFLGAGVIFQRKGGIVEAHYRRSVPGLSQQSGSWSEPLRIFRAFSQRSWWWRSFRLIACPPP